MILDDLNKIKIDLAQVSRLALGEKTDDVRLFIAKLVRQYRESEPSLSEELAGFLRASSPRPAPTMMRRMSSGSDGAQLDIPVDEDSRLSLLKIYSGGLSAPKPILSNEIDNALSMLIKEREQRETLAKRGLEPSKSAIFVGAPGVGKTITARWIAGQLGVPLFVLDLSAVMSSLLGKSGANLRNAFDFAKSNPCVLLLDEIDAIAKRRSDESDIGELKRLVTVILQEVDEWPASGLLLAATNHSELIDPALWRRFDLVVEFGSPNSESVLEAIKRFMGQDLNQFKKWLDVLSYACRNESFSDIERSILRLRRAIVVGESSAENLVLEFVKAKCELLDRPAQLDLAILLDSCTDLSQRRVSDITGISRDTIRKHRPNSCAM